MKLPWLLYVVGEIRQVQQKEPGIENYRSDECGGTEMLLSKRESAHCTDILATMSLRHVFIPITTIVQIDKNRSPKP